MDVLTHEAGHAFAAYQARNMEIRENASTTMETAEVHSMTMELMARPWAELFLEMTLKNSVYFNWNLPLTLFRMVVWWTNFSMRCMKIQD